jgi:anti-repressor protein
MTELIPVRPGPIGGSATWVVDARDLHYFLQVGRDFSTWIRGRIDEYGFEEDTDYAMIDSPKLVNQSRRGGDRRSKDCHLTLDMAKELAMAERNDKGRQARRYFINCERQLLAI